MKRKLIAFLLLLACIGGIHVASAYGYRRHRGGWGWGGPFLAGGLFSTAVAAGAASSASSARDAVRELERDVREAIREVKRNMNVLEERVSRIEAKI